LGQVPPVTFLFSGDGSYDANLDRQLSALSPVYQEARQRCDEWIAPHLEHSPLGERAGRRGAIFALQYSLVQLWRAWGVAPAVVMGQDVGAS
jgi:acyl transferase domain-containing protein